MIEQRFGDQKAEVLREQQTALDGLSQNPNWVRSLPRLRSVLQLFGEEYRKVKEITVSDAPAMNRMGPDQLASLNDRQRKAYYQSACSEELQRHRITATNAIADAMLTEIEKRTRMLDAMIATLRTTQSRWESDHTDAPEMQGRLTQEHPYRHNVFDQSAIPDPNAIDAVDTAISPSEADRVLKVGLEHMAAALAGDERTARETANREAANIMENMIAAYHQALDEMRLLEVLQLVYPGDKAQQQAALGNHMRWMATSARSTLRHDPSLWGDQGARQLEIRAHLAVDYEDERERQMVETARAATGGFGERSPGYVPPGELMQSNDHARLQLLYSHHGISLSSIPFLSDAAGGCVKSLKDRQAMWDRQGGLPVFSCQVMQDLVLTPGIFFDPVMSPGGAGASLPMPDPYAQNAPDLYASQGVPGLPVPPVPSQGRNLVERIERRSRS